MLGIYFVFTLFNEAYKFNFETVVKLNFNSPVLTEDVNSHKNPPKLRNKTVSGEAGSKDKNLEDVFKKETAM